MFLMVKLFGYALRITAGILDTRHILCLKITIILRNEKIILLFFFTK